MQIVNDTAILNIVNVISEVNTIYIIGAKPKKRKFGEIPKTIKAVHHNGFSDAGIKCNIEKAGKIKEMVRKKRKIVTDFLGKKYKGGMQK